MTTPHQNIIAAPAADPDDLALVAALRRGDEAVFLELIDRLHSSLLRLALLYVSHQALAEEVVQETWQDVLQALPRFDGRCSLKLWIARILVERAKTRAQSEGRSIPFAALEHPIEAREPALEADRFLSADHPRWPGHWASSVHSWETLPEERLFSAETYAQIDVAITALPPSQQAIITLRDIEGWTSTEVCYTFAISEADQQALLHQARSKVRRALEQYFDDERGPSL